MLKTSPMQSFSQEKKMKPKARSTSLDLKKPTTGNKSVKSPESCLARKHSSFHCRTLLFIQSELLLSSLQDSQASRQLLISRNAEISLKFVGYAQLIRFEKELGFKDPSTLLNQHSKRQLTGTKNRGGLK
jgi:hypothetical protein